jgi:cytochrome c-type biogenesis protein CcmE
MKMTMRLSGAIITGIIATLAMGGVVAAFMTNASPYVTVAEAKQSKNDSMHLAGSLLKETVRTDPRNGQISFKLKDDTGAVAQIVYTGSQPGNLMEATKVVAIGGMQGDVFKAHQLLVKCPSKYETEQAAKAAKV